MPIRRTPLIVLVATTVLLSIVGYRLIAQEPAKTPVAETPVAETSLIDSFASDKFAEIDLDEPTPEPTATERIDQIFASAVGVMESVFFYKLWTETQEYIVYEHHEYYLRIRESQSPFLKHDPNGTLTQESLSEDDLRLLAAQGKLLGDDGTRHFRLGKIGNRLVEYVTIKVDDEHTGLNYGDKYVLRGEKFAKVLPPRGVLSETETLSTNSAKTLADRGWLKVGESPDDSLVPTYLLSEKVGGAPVVVLWLACGAVFFTIYMRGFNLWGFRHAIQIVRGKYDNPKEAGEVTHFQALAAALSATVGLGNIAGVTIAMTMGGPGAFFWMILCGLFGMTSKFTECTLGQKYRIVKPDGTILGGPMRYLRAGLAELGLEPLGVLLSVSFSVMCILASFGGGNMYQAKESGKAVLVQVQRGDYEALAELDKKIKTAADANNIGQLKELQVNRSELKKSITSFGDQFMIGYGLVLATLVAVVIIGGIRRIGAAAEKVVPTMCLMYVAACLWIIANHFTEIPALVTSIFTDAFSGKAMGGGLMGVLVIGVTRAAFSNEAGVGSAAIAHSAAKTDEPVREGAVALLGPFIDTIVVCSMTALVILITGAWDNKEWVVDRGLTGAALTSTAFQSEISWFPWVLSIAVVLFAYSTIVSWSYYGEKCTELLFGPRSRGVYKVLAVTCVFVGSVVDAGAVLAFSDMMILSMAFPNILGVVLLAPKVKRDLANYWRRYKNDEFKTFK